MRLTCNPFFSYLDARLDAWVQAAGSPARGVPTGD